MKKTIIFTLLILMLCASPLMASDLYYAEGVAEKIFYDEIEQEYCMWINTMDGSYWVERGTVEIGTMVDIYYTVDKTGKYHEYELFRLYFK